MVHVSVLKWKIFEWQILIVVIDCERLPIWWVIVTSLPLSSTCRRKNSPWWIDRMTWNWVRWGMTVELECSNGLHPIIVFMFPFFYFHFFCIQISFLFMQKRSMSIKYNKNNFCTWKFPFFLRLTCGISFLLTTNTPSEINILFSVCVSRTILLLTKATQRQATLRVMKNKLQIQMSFCAL